MPFFVRKRMEWNLRCDCSVFCDPGATLNKENGYTEG